MGQGRWGLGGEVGGLGSRGLESGGWVWGVVVGGVGVGIGGVGVTRLESGFEVEGVGVGVRGL